MNQALLGRTVLLITHRLRGLEDADRILVLEQGRVVARGTHDELLEQGGWYAEQWWAEAEREDMSALLPTLPVGRAVPRPVQ
jgi:ABC-type multidrug transport system fused ATPase/permease subunit